MEIFEGAGEDGIFHVGALIEDHSCATLVLAFGIALSSDGDVFFAGEVGGEGHISHLSYNFETQLVTLVLAEHADLAHARLALEWYTLHL